MAIIALAMCTLLAAALDYLGLIDAWDVPCPVPSHRRVLVFIALPFLIFGHRLLVNRKLTTGERIDPAP